MAIIDIGFKRGAFYCSSKANTVLKPSATAPPPARNDSSSLRSVFVVLKYGAFKLFADLQTINVASCIAFNEMFVKSITYGKHFQKPRVYIYKRIGGEVIQLLDA